jgi:hypothetical protein
MFEWFNRNTDKLILMLLVLGFSFMALHVMHDGGDMEAREWITGLVAGAASALYVLITGGRSTPATEKKDDGTKDSSKPV